jgi:hypothetical protein
MQFVLRREQVEFARLAGEQIGDPFFERDPCLSKVFGRQGGRGV